MRMEVSKLALCWPWSPPFTYTAFVESILALKHPVDFQTKWIRGSGWCNSRRRNDACEKALDWEADYIVMLDSDQIYPDDILTKFAHHMETGKDLVAAMVPQRGYTAGSGMKPFQRLAWKTEDNLTLIPVNPGEGDLQECALPSCAAMVFKAQHLRRMKKPWFKDQFNAETWKREFAEDLNFILNIRKQLNLTAWVDTTIEVKHLHLFEIDDTFSERFKDWETPGRGDSSCRYEVEEHRWHPQR